MGVSPGTLGPAGTLMKDPDEMTKARMVALIFDSKTEAAIGELCDWYRIEEPRLGVGVFEGKTKGVAAVYSLRRKEILAANREYLYNPFVMIHEFYHHLRSTSGSHRGTERQADLYAAGFMAAYYRLAGIRLPRDKSGEG